MYYAFLVQLHEFSTIFRQVVFVIFYVYTFTARQIDVRVCFVGLSFLSMLRK